MQHFLELVDLSPLNKIHEFDIYFVVINIKNVKQISVARDLTYTAISAKLQSLVVIANSFNTCLQLYCFEHLTIHKELETVCVRLKLRAQKTFWGIVDLKWQVDLHSICVDLQLVIVHSQSRFMSQLVRNRQLQICDLSIYEN